MRNYFENSSKTLSKNSSKTFITIVIHSPLYQAPSDYFDAEPTFKQSYAPQSGAIFGILKQMKETFETNLESSQKEEMQSPKFGLTLS